MKYLGFGANLDSAYGTPLQTINAALAALAQRGVQTVQLSRFFISEPVPRSDQPLYTNCAAEVATTLSPDALLTVCNDIEATFGRVRRFRNEPRPIDIDLLDIDGRILQSPQLTLPHPRMDMRAFVLYPLQDIAPDWVHPATGQTLDTLIKALPDDQTIRLYDAT